VTAVASEADVGQIGRDDEDRIRDQRGDLRE
jgi:hypothetical protein